MTDIPPEFMCPIRHELMIDPVIGTDGHTYEREAIEEWLQHNRISPMTRESMSISELKQNYALLGAIERFRLANNNTIVQVDKHNTVPTEPLRRDFSVKLVSDSVLELAVVNGQPVEPVIIAVIDVSGSMAISVSQKIHDTEGPEMSRLDLVKHSLKTVATILNKRYEHTKSSLGIVSFSDKSQVVLPITAMDDIGLANAYRIVDSLRAQGSTNIWDGLRMGLEQAMGVPANKNCQIIVLTDGEPSSEYTPPRGIVPTLYKKWAGMSNKPELSCFGFGYNLDTFLLNDICQLGGGSYGYIPDCSMVGTVFINYISNVLSTVANNITLVMEQEPVPVRLWRIGTIQIDKPRTILTGPTIKTNNELKIIYNNVPLETLTIREQTVSTQSAINIQTIKSLLDILECAIRDRTAGISRLQSFYETLEAEPNKTEFTNDILRDIVSTSDNEGQLMKAVSQEDWYNSWGRNHLVSYVRALRLERCVNFKDMAIQHFAGSLFEQIQEEANDVFCSLPPPTPSVSSYRVSSYSITDQQPTTRNANMSLFNDRGGGCFLGHCLVKMADGSQRPVCEVRKGDLLAEGFEVQAVVKTRVQSQMRFCQFSGGLVITPWHPIRLSAENPWIFPNTFIDPNVRQPIDWIYDFVLDRGHYATINDWQVITLGHGMTDSPIVSHPYYGTARIIVDLMTQPGWKQGLVELDIMNTQRDNITDLISKVI